MATTASACSRTSLAAALVLALATPAAAQSQGGTGVGGALGEVQGITAEIDALITRHWDGRSGRWIKGGIGAAGMAAALLSAYDAVAGGDSVGTLSGRIDGQGLVRLGVTTGTGPAAAPVGAATGTR